MGFEIVRVQGWLSHGGSTSFHNELERREKNRNKCMRLLDKRLGSALGKAKWETKEPVIMDRCDNNVEMMVAEFQPRRSTS